MENDMYIVYAYDTTDIPKPIGIVNEEEAVMLVNEYAETDIELFVFEVPTDMLEIKEKADSLCKLYEKQKRKEKTYDGTNKIYLYVDNTSR